MLIHCITMLWENDGRGNNKKEYFCLDSLSKRIRKVEGETGPLEQLYPPCASNSRPLAMSFVDYTQSLLRSSADTEAVRIIIELFLIYPNSLPASFSSVSFFLKKKKKERKNDHKRCFYSSGIESHLFFQPIHLGSSTRSCSTGRVVDLSGCMARVDYSKRRAGGNGRRSSCVIEVNGTNFDMFVFFIKCSLALSLSGKYCGRSRSSKYQ